MKKTIATALIVAIPAIALAQETYSMNTAEFQSRYRTNKVALLADTAGKNVRISGYVAAVQTDSKGAPVIELTSGGGSLQPVYLEMGLPQLQEAGKLAKGQSVTITCSLVERRPTAFPQATGCRF